MKSFIPRVDAEYQAMGGEPFVVKFYEDDKKVVLKNDCVWELMSSDRLESTYGRGFDYLWITEAPYHPDEVWYSALLPMLRRPHRMGHCVAEGRPSSPDNWFEKLYNRGLHDDPEVYSSHHTTYDNPEIDIEKLEYDLEHMPEETFRQEYLAETIADEGAVFRNIESCVSGQLEDPREGYRYVLGVDLAKYRDFTVIIVMHPMRKRVVAYEKISRMDWVLQKEKIRSYYEKWGKAAVILDTHGVGDPVCDELRKSGIPVTAVKLATPMIKADLINALRTAIENERIHFPHIPELIKQLKIYRRRATTKSGDPAKVDRFAAPKGYHDDFVIALALAYKGCGSSDWVETPLETTVYA